VSCNRTGQTGDVGAVNTGQNDTSFVAHVLNRTGRIDGRARLETCQSEGPPVSRAAGPSLLNLSETGIEKDHARAAGTMLFPSFE